MFQHCTSNGCTEPDLTSDNVNQLWYLNLQPDYPDGLHTHIRQKLLLFLQGGEGLQKHHMQE